MAAILQTFSDSFSWMRIVSFWFQLHWSLFLKSNWQYGTGEFPAIHRGPVNSPHKWPGTRKMVPFDDVIMLLWVRTYVGWNKFAYSIRTHDIDVNNSTRITQQYLRIAHCFNGCENERPGNNTFGLKSLELPNRNSQCRDCFWVIYRLHKLACCYHVGSFTALCLSCYDMNFMSIMTLRCALLHLKIQTLLKAKYTSNFFVYLSHSWKPLPIPMNKMFILSISYI